MAYDPPGPHNRWSASPYSAVTDTEIDTGLRHYMVRVYNYMAAGLGISGLVAYLAVSTSFYQHIVGTPLIWIVMLAPLGMVLLLSFGISRINTGAAKRAKHAERAYCGTLRSSAASARPRQKPCAIWPNRRSRCRGLGRAPLPHRQEMVS